MDAQCYFHSFAKLPKSSKFFICTSLGLIDDVALTFTSDLLGYAVE